MRRTQRTLERISQRMQQLDDTFVECLDRFDAQPTFVGPQVHFHLKTLDRLRSRGLAAVLSDADDIYWEFLYATLAAWGLHRMGAKSNTRLVDFDDFRDSMLSHREPILELQGYTITWLTDPGDLASVTARLQSLVESLRIAISPSKVVANSKALHHLLPELVPPIDRRYTLRLFYDSFDPPGITDCFGEIFPLLAGLAARHEPTIRARVGTGFHTSTSKVIDNAVIGCVMGWD
jgi:hypothetical protein